MTDNLNTKIVLLTKTDVSFNDKIDPKKRNQVTNVSKLSNLYIQWGLKKHSSEEGANLSCFNLGQNVFSHYMFLAKKWQLLKLSSTYITDWFSNLYSWFLIEVALDICKTCPVFPLQHFRRCYILRAILSLIPQLVWLEQTRIFPH